GFPLWLLSAAGTPCRPTLLRRLPLVEARLTDVLLHLDAEHGRPVAVMLLQIGEQPLADVAGKQLGGGVLDGQQHAVLAREKPFALAVADVDALCAHFHHDEAVLRRQHHAVVEKWMLFAPTSTTMKRFCVGSIMRWSSSSVIARVRCFSAMKSKT